MVMTIQSEVKKMILVAQGEAFKQENVLTERLHGLDQHMERKEDGSLYFMNRIWVPLVGYVRMVILDEAHNSKGILLHTDAAALEELCLAALIGTSLDLVKTAVGAKFILELEKF
ncbi:hypothetical protein Tco_0160044 [Tanacetum coccineum]